MTPKQAYQMGFRHIADLAEMNRIGELIRNDEFCEEALQLVRAWREGAATAAAMIEKAHATLQ